MGKCRARPHKAFGYDDLSGLPKAIASLMSRTPPIGWHRHVRGTGSDRHSLHLNSATRLTRHDLALPSWAVVDVGGCIERHGIGISRLQHEAAGGGYGCALLAACPAVL